jgi:hypothetical protein
MNITAVTLKTANLLTITFILYVVLTVLRCGNLLFESELLERKQSFALRSQRPRSAQMNDMLTVA